MPSHPIVAIGASAGGVETLLKIARGLPRDFPAAVFVVLHVPANSASVLPRLLSRTDRMPAAYGEQGQAIEPGRIYVAPPDHHLLIEDGHIVLGRGARENGTRPAVDPLFRSAARAYGPATIGVVLSGSLYDGTVGLQAIKAAGGTAIVQDPEDATYPSMPRSALESVKVDHVVTGDACAALLEKLVREQLSSRTPSVAQSPADLRKLELEVGVSESTTNEEASPPDMLGQPSGFACPDCHGVMWEIKDGELLRFRCRVGHAYLPDGLMDAQADKLEEALWIALRSLRESAALATRLAARARDRKWDLIAESHEERAREADDRARTIEDVLDRGKLGAAQTEGK